MRAFAHFLLSSLLLALTGCAGYHLGPTNGVTAGAKSIQVNFFQNQTHEPRLVEAINSEMRKSLQRDGTYRLDTHGDGDLIVTGSIIHFNRAPISFQPSDIITARDYALSMSAHIMVRDRSTGKVLLDRDVAGRTTIRVGSDLASAERQAVPLMAEDLARNATSMIVDGAW